MLLDVSIKLDLSDDLCDQVQRNGCVLEKHGSRLRVRVGTRLLGKDQATVNIQEVQSDAGQKQKTPGG